MHLGVSSGQFIYMSFPSEVVITRLPFVADEPARRTQVESRCDRVATVVDRTVLATRPTVDVPWRNFS